MVGKTRIVNLAWTLGGIGEIQLGVGAGSLAMATAMAWVSDLDCGKERAGDPKQAVCELASMLFVRFVRFEGLCLQGDGQVTAHARRQEPLSSLQTPS